MIREIGRESVRVKEALLDQQSTIILRIAEKLVTVLQQGGTIYLCGNGGSAADAQHIAAELVGRFARERQAWPSVALSTNTSILTAIGNDYGFEQVFARQVEALVQDRDALVGISTSGNSSNVLKAMGVARRRQALLIGCTGQEGGRLKDVVDLCIQVPSASTPRIQEAHILVWHIICEIIESTLTGQI
jgi:D-sedoheptulose 7-phosphate isomerase